MQLHHTKTKSGRFQLLTAIHPVGTGLGVAAGAIAGAAMGTPGGPMAALIGGAVGAFIGGLTGQGLAEGMDPAPEISGRKLRPRSRDCRKSTSSRGPSSYGTRND